LAKDLGAAGADNDGLGVREDGGDGEASGALDVHEERAGAGDKSLKVHVRGKSRCGVRLYQTHLQLVLAGLSQRAGVEEIDCENL